MQPKGNCVTSQAHSGSPKCHCRQAVRTQTGDSDGVVSPSRGFRPTLPEVAQTGSRPICNQIQSQTSPFCVSGSRPVGLEVGCVDSSVGGFGCFCLSPGSYSGTGGHQAVGPQMSPNHPDCPGLTKHAMVLGQPVGSNSPLTSQGREFAISTVQPVSTQRSPQPNSACLAPRATAILQADFSDEVATRIEAPQRCSTRAVYESKWAVFVRWCEEHKVDFRSPSIKQMADFLLFFRKSSFQPSIIDGYRTAIADKVGKSQINISKDKNLTRLLDSFHRNKPKGIWGVPVWNLSLVVHQLTKPPFEPLRKTYCNHLTFTVFLLALGSGKRRSEIHPWVHKNIRHKEDWSNV